MEWTELIKQRMPEINYKTCLYATKLALALEERQAFDLGATIICSSAFVITFELSPHSFIYVCRGILHPYQPYHFCCYDTVILEQTFDEILKLIDTNWSDIFNVKGP